MKTATPAGGQTHTHTYDVIRQTRQPAGITSVDADNCYARIAHTMALLVFQAFGMPSTAAKSMLTTIQEMKLFLRMGFGESTDFASSKFKIKTRGFAKGMEHPQQAGQLSASASLMRIKRRDMEPILSARSQS